MTQLEKTPLEKKATAPLLLVLSFIFLVCDKIELQHPFVVFFVKNSRSAGGTDPKKCRKGEEY